MMMSVRLLCAAAVLLGICACRPNAYEDSPRQERDTAADVFVGGSPVRVIGCRRDGLDGGGSAEEPWTDGRSHG